MSDLLQTRRQRLLDIDRQLRTMVAQTAGYSDRDWQAMRDLRATITRIMRHAPKKPKVLRTPAAAGQG